MLPETRFVSLLAVVLAACAIAACGGGTGDAADQYAADDVVAVDSNPAGDPYDVGSDLEGAGFAVDVVDQDGISVDPSDAADCDIAEVTPSGMVEVGSTVTIDVDCAEVYWDNREGQAWNDYVDAYVTAFDEGCASVFADAPNGSLYADEIEYSDSDCGSASELDAEESDLLPADVPDQPADAGTEAGSYDGCVSIFDDVGGELYYGDTAYDESMCD